MEDNKDPYAEERPFYLHECRYDEDNPAITPAMYEFSFKQTFVHIILGNYFRQDKKQVLNVVLFDDFLREFKKELTSNCEFILHGNLKHISAMDEEEF